jgi:hypothetical protein
MKNIIPVLRPLILTLLALVSFITASFAQEVIIPDPNLNTAIHEVLGEPAGPLTQQDMLSLTNPGAVFRNITNVQGLEAAQNLVLLDLQDNRITSVDILTNSSCPSHGETRGNDSSLFDSCWEHEPPRSADVSGFWTG